MLGLPAQPTTATIVNDFEPKNSGDQPAATSDRPFQFTLRGLLLLFAVFVVVIGLVVAARRLSRLSQLNAREAQCSNRLENIGMTLCNYHTTMGTFPPPILTDNDGKALQSWRNLIDPYSILSDLRQGIYDPDEPWNSPSMSSRPMFTRSPDTFQCPVHKPSKPHTTNYLAITGPGTAWPGEQSVRLDDIKDGPSNTILIVEVPDSDVHWMEPRDLDFAGLEKAVKKHGGLRVLFADGRVGFIPASIPRDQLKALVTIAGDEEIDRQYVPGR